MRVPKNIPKTSPKSILGRMLVSKTVPKSKKNKNKNDVEKRLEQNSLQDPQKKSASRRSDKIFGPPSLGLPPFLIYNIHPIQRPARPSASRHPPSTAGVQKSSIRRPSLADAADSNAPRIPPSPLRCLDA